MPHRRRARAATAACALAGLLLLTTSACGDGAQGAGGAADLESAPAAQRLDEVCPATVVVQADWEPEAEHGPIYNLVGPGYRVDADQKRVTGPLVVDGRDTGVDIEVRAGGAAIGYQSISSQMYVDDSITLGMVTTDGAIAAAADQPVTAVMALMNKSPQMLMWDPETHPDWETIADIGGTDAKVVYVAGSTYASLLVSEGLVQESQLDASYDGSPSRFVADPSIAQQGFATAEPYIYEHEVGAWGKPVRYQLLADVGYSVYPEALSVRSGDLEDLAPCLEKLVPLMQQSAADFAADPGPVVDLVADLVTQYNTGWVYSAETGTFAARQMVDLGILANEADGTVGGFDMDRVEQTRQVFTPLITESGADVPPGLTAEDLATDRFVDPSIGIG
ncbi:ABC transporter substrate-binding protein [Streptomyces hoynatensis]|uniref:ABC transporter substrate-binding protein n=1 Tax=Streptomyces hoynatensis TaxID=1141874 RepID=A0A3A9YUZ0_9ACTN|nr:ABC transporter substrate-binding protein [Streptomyces hoynatensis]RKN39046.1 ABC transporter substrate-binding protein [Streptomyces hoynatensis]